MTAGSGEALRQQLEGAMRARVQERMRQGSFGTCLTPAEAANVACSIVEAALAAQAEEIATKIQNTAYYVYPPPEGEERARLSGLRTARDAAAALVRGSVPAPKQEKP